MPQPRAFAQVDVFSPEPTGGNPVAVVLDADGLDPEAMQRFAAWTNLSETTFVQTPTTGDADYAVRIFTPSTEMPFAGHPTLGTAHAWREHTGHTGELVTQECGVGLVQVRTDGDSLLFAAPPLRRSGPVEESELRAALSAAGLRRDEVEDSAWVDNGPGWLAIRVADTQRLLSLRPDVGHSDTDEPDDLDGDTNLGVVALTDAGAPEALEVRAWFRGPGGRLVEDPVTGSLNASVAQWLLGAGILDAPYTARQGTALGRTGRVRITTEGEQVWVGGTTTTVVSGTVIL